ncbi:hypothetical protein LINPERPRIM_LOCUS10605, partial [Linum perenne]
FINQERKLGARRRSDTVLVSTINAARRKEADWREPLGVAPPTDLDLLRRVRVRACLSGPERW